MVSLPCLHALLACEHGVVSLARVVLVWGLVGAVQLHLMQGIGN